MAGELVSFGIQKLWGLLSQESKRFQGVEDQVTELKRALNLLTSFLKDADAKKHTSAVVKNCIEEIKDIVYDAEDIIETYLLKEELGKTSGIKKRIRRLACIIPDRREITSDMRGINKRISEVICDMKDFGVQQIIVDGMDSQPLQVRQREMRQEFAGKYESELVGLEANVKKLVEYLVEEDDVQVVSITGMGGLGKTTLARQAFNHDMVKNKFDGLAWVCVSQVLNRKNVWQTILQNLTPKEKKNEVLEMTEATLQEELFRLLETSKSLIVFDDIWKEEHWDLIKPIFPPEKGWKVLLTSRKEIVTTRRNTINFKPKCLTTEDSWTLFKMIALPRKDASEFMVDEEMQEIGKQMIEHCGGLPLAIRVLGSLLAAKYTFHNWKRVSENIGSHLMGRMDLNDDNNSSVYHVLSLSFEELPSYLKHCFLYLAHFPEDYQISVHKLSYYWAAEGFAKPRYQDGETIRDVGDVYIEELVRRNMVISERDSRTLRFQTCHLHDMMREICLIKSKEENFLQIDGIRSPTANSQSRRLVLQIPTTLDVERNINNPKLRSLLIVSDYRGKRWTISGSSVIRLELLRVLDLSHAKFEGGKLPYGIGKLIHLRYLSLYDAKVSDLPSSLRNLKLLVYLHIGVLSYEKDIFVPNVLMGMKEVRYLELPKKMHEKTKLELCNLENLETLKNFSTKNTSLENLRHMSRLRILAIKLTKEACLETLSVTLGGLRHLEKLDIDDHDGIVRKIETGFIVNFVHLKHLSLRIYMPSLLKPLPSHLTTIYLSWCRLEEDPMPILEKLPQLKRICLNWNAFSGRRMVCSGGGFPQLQKLECFGLEEWEEWIVEEGSMPLLHTLIIIDCKKLKEVPDGLRFITSLKDLSVRRMGTKEWKERLSEGGEDYYKVQHIPSVKFSHYP